ncbi:MAG: YtxH protein [Flavipsychrobacter sp.]|jgi:gas vesicle protein|nr:YtxH protein [Flavipsychrobacter sp.]
MSTSRFLAGALVGLVAGLLLAPEKGSELRSDISDTAENLKNRLNSILGRAGGPDLDDLRSFLDKNISGLSDDVKHRILTIIDEASDMAYSAKPHMSNGVI